MDLLAPGPDMEVCTCLAPYSAPGCRLCSPGKGEGIPAHVQDQFLQRRAGGPVSHRKRPQPSPARGQQGLGRAPKRPAFTLMPHGFHAGAAESGDASDEGETVMLDAGESPALSTPFR